MTARRDDFAEQVDYLDRLGPRPTSNDAHRTLVDDVAKRLAALGLTVNRDPHRFTRWDAPRDDAHLNLTVGGRPVPISSAYPYSGTTGRVGVTGRLHPIRGGLRKNWAAAAGGVAVVQVRHFPFPYDLWVSEWDGPAARDEFDNPVLSATLNGPNLAAARKAGVTAVIAVWKGLPDSVAAGQYLPFTNGYHDLPAVWVAERDGQDLLGAARAGAEAHLVLDAAVIPFSESDTVWAVSEGESTEETILIVTHSDGTNSVEENGHIGLLELARQATAARHRRTMVFVLTTGHLRIPAVAQHGQATSAWFDAHPDLWAGRPGQARAVAGLVIEHLGARHYATDPVTNAYSPTGRAEPELLYATTPETAAIARRDWNTSTPAQTHVSKPSPLIHLGEGETLYERRIPAVALVTAPEYLLAELDGPLVDVDLLERQVDGFARLLRTLDSAADPAQLGTVTLPSTARKTLSRLRALGILARRSRDHRRRRRTADRQRPGTTTTP